MLPKVSTGPIKVDTREKSPVPAGRAGLLPVVYQSFTSRLLSRLLSRLPSRLPRVYQESEMCTRQFSEVQIQGYDLFTLDARISDSWYTRSKRLGKRLSKRLSKRLVNDW